MYNETEITKLVNQVITDLIPAGNAACRIQNGEILISSKWKQGEIKRVDVDKSEVKVNYEKARHILEKILKASSRFRKAFTGTLELKILLKDARINGLYWQPGNWIINPRSTRRNYKFSQKGSEHVIFPQ